MKRATTVGAVVVGMIGTVALLWPKGPPQESAGRYGHCPSVYVACHTLEGNSYHRRAMLAWDCRADGGVGFVLQGKKLPAIVGDTCELAPDGAAPPMDLPLPCACRTKTGACVTADGGVAPYGQTLQPGWSGPGCERKACVELVGSTSWPARCPNER